ncbi:MAG: hypothetical protein FD180_3938 [Planctomycetota bacterium]|nr:MAG: hypothetical protein FD180_3938 [Planctomycetota bacterium]
MHRPLTEDAQDAYVHLLAGDLNTDGLARLMGVSRATAFRLVGELRRGGRLIEVVKLGARWHYEVADDFEALWKNDPVAAHVGFIKNGPVLEPGESVDDAIYGPRKKAR